MKTTVTIVGYVDPLLITTRIVKTDVKNVMYVSITNSNGMNPTNAIVIVKTQIQPTTQLNRILKFT
jgi:hypothetical protein